MAYTYNNTELNFIFRRKDIDSISEDVCFSLSSFGYNGYAGQSDLFIFGNAMNNNSSCWALLPTSKDPEYTAYTKYTYKSNYIPFATKSSSYVPKVALSSESYVSPFSVNKIFTGDSSDYHNIIISWNGNYNNPKCIVKSVNNNETYYFDGDGVFLWLQAPGGGGGGGDNEYLFQGAPAGGGGGSGASALIYLACKKLYCNSTLPKLCYFKLTQGHAGKAGNSGGNFTNGTDGSNIVLNIITTTMSKVVLTLGGGKGGSGGAWNNTTAAAGDGGSYSSSSSPYVWIIKTFNGVAGGQGIRGGTGKQGGSFTTSEIATPITSPFKLQRQSISSGTYVYTGVGFTTSHAGGGGAGSPSAIINPNLSLFNGYGAGGSGAQSADSDKKATDGNPSEIVILKNY